MPNFGLNEKDDPCWCEKNIAALTFFFALIGHFSMSKTVTSHEINSWGDRNKPLTNTTYQNVLINENFFQFIFSEMNKNG